MEDEQQQETNEELPAVQTFVKPLKATIEATPAPEQSDEKQDDIDSS
jgi:hypothetical protein